MSRPVAHQCNRLFDMSKTYEETNVAQEHPEEVGKLHLLLEMIRKGNYNELPANEMP